MYLLIYILHSFIVCLLLYTIDYVYIDEFWSLFLDDSDRWSRYVGIIHSYLIPIKTDTTLRLASILFSVYNSYRSNIYFLNNISNDSIGLVFLSNEYIYMNNYINQIESCCIIMYY